MGAEWGLPGHGPNRVPNFLSQLNSWKKPLSVASFQTTGPEDRCAHSPWAGKALGQAATMAQSEKLLLVGKREDPGKAAVLRPWLFPFSTLAASV